MSFKETELGKIPLYWDVAKLGDVADVLSGFAFKSKDFVDSGVPVIKIKNIVPPYVTTDDTVYVSQELYELSEKYQLNYNDVLISMTGSNYNQLSSAVGKVGRVRLKDKPMLLNQRVGKILTNEKKCNKEFLYYNISTMETRYRLALSAGGSANQANVSPKQIKSLLIPYPPLEEQKVIAHILSTLDEKIEVNNQINKTLENMAQAIFKQWFVDFEFPNEDGEPYKSSGGEMIESELGMIPKGWEVEEIGNISDIQNGFAFKAPEYVDEGVKVLRTLNIGNDGYFNNTDIVFLPQSYKSEKYEKYYFEEFDVALVMVGASIGKIGMILKNTAGGLQNQNMWRFRRKEKRVSQIFIYYTVKQAQNISKNWSTGSARDFYRKDSFRKINVILPEKRITDLFEKITKPIFQNISNHVCENDELISMRDSLLPKLMSGEIRVPLDSERDAS